MQIATEHTEKMENIMEDMRDGSSECLKKFLCYTSSLEELHPVKGVEAFDAIQCMSGDSRCCVFSFGVMEDRYCECPLRTYIAEHFHR